MKLRQVHLRPQMRYLSMNPGAAASPSTNPHQLTQKPFPERTFFKPDSTDGQSLVKRLCRDNKHKEAIEILCQRNRLKEAVELLEQHLDRPPSNIYAVLLQFCIQQRALREGERIHNHIRLRTLQPGIFLSNQILHMYCKCGNLEDAHKVFDEMCEKDLCSWNILISGCAKTGRIDLARRLFNEMPERDNFSWTAMVSGYVKLDMPEDALELYRLMQKQDINFLPSEFTVSSALSAASSIRSLRLGREIHGHIFRSGLDSDTVLCSALSDMYGKCGRIDQARYVFDMTFEKDVVSWTAMIDRYFESGRWEEGFLLFSNLLNSGIKPNDFTIAGVLNACAHQTVESLGKQVHGYMTRSGYDPASFATSALVHMYSKCGNMDSGHKVFTMLPRFDLHSWTSLICGYAQNGQPHEALRLFESLLETGNKPDEITFVGILSACTHAGLVEKGIEYFNSIRMKHGLTYIQDHYACVVDLLSRAGRFGEAEEVIKEMSSMQMKPDKFMWASLLGGCRIYGNLELAKVAAEALYKIEPENPATYVTLANIYANAGKWNEVARIRKDMDDKGVVKKAGLSWINLRRKNHVFMAGDKSHERIDEIYEFLEDMSKRMKLEGYIPDTNSVLHDVEEEQKEQNLFYHSEKLAVAFGIIFSTDEEGSLPIKVFKNLRTCVDCHKAIKFISKITGRTIIVRDSSRFHHFHGGNCSCKDYW